MEDYGVLYISLWTFGGYSEKHAQENRLKIPSVDAVYLLILCLK